MLTENQRRFVDLLGIPGTSATEAYRQAFGCSEESARRNASRLLTKADIHAAIEARREEAAKAVGVTTERVVTELCRIAFSDKRKLLRPDGSIKTPAEWDDDTAATIAGIESDELHAGTGENRVKIGDRRKVKQWDKVKALELLGKHLGMFVERHEHSGPGGKPIENNVTINPIDRINQLAPAFESAADRAGEGNPPSDSSGKPMDTGVDQKRPDGQTG